MIYRLSIMILLAFASVMCKGESARIFDIIIGGGAADVPEAAARM